MEFDRMDENDWKYHGEGNKSLVVSHVQHCRVLRLLKYPAEDSENPPQTAEQAFRQIQNIVDFSSNVMSSLLGETFVHSGEVVRLPLEFVRQLSIKIQHQRPAWRCDKVMDIYSGCALCLPNLTSPTLHQPTPSPPLCIEIKPKCGFLPSPKHVSKDIKTRVCRYCMHQHYKVANGKWKRRSLYCPLDLFSGNKQRMHFAIRHLIEEPQNNLKVFKGGQCIYSSKEGSDESPDLNALLHLLRPYFLRGNNRINGHMTPKAVLNDFIQVLVNALLSDAGGDGGQVTDRAGGGRSLCEASLFNNERIRHGSQGLPTNSVLSRILQTQMLDTLDIEGLYPLYRRVEQHLQDFPKDRTRLQIDGPYDQNFLEKVQKCSEDDGSVEYAAAKVHQYRIAMTAKDCSIMAALVPRVEEEEDDEELLRSTAVVPYLRWGRMIHPLMWDNKDPNWVTDRRKYDLKPPASRATLYRRLSSQKHLRDFRPQAFSSSVSILDLDPKPLDSIPRQLRLDQKIVSCYLRTGGALPMGSLPLLPNIITAAEREERTLLFQPV